MNLICSSIPFWGRNKWLCKADETSNLSLDSFNLVANSGGAAWMFLSWFCLSDGGQRLHEKWWRSYFRPYFTVAPCGMGWLYCGDSNGHVHFESFSSHISLTLRTLVLFIFRLVTSIGHGMKYILRSCEKYLERRRRRLLSFYSSMQVESRRLPGAVIVLTANAARLQTSTRARYIASEEMNYKPISSQESDS